MCCRQHNSRDSRIYLKFKSYRRKPVSSDLSVANWYFVIPCFYIIKRQRHWIPEPAPYSIRGQARNDKKTQKTYFEIGSKQFAGFTLYDLFTGS